MPADSVNATAGQDARTSRLQAVATRAKAPSAPPAQATRRQRLVRLLLPRENGSGEIRALDGVRAIAALSIVIFHTLLYKHVEFLPASRAIGNVWYYFSMGVQLFFVLSGFLLFRP